MISLEKSSKGFVIGRLNSTAAKRLGWGIPEGQCVCMECNKMIGNDIRYIVVLNDTICEECFKEWHNRAKRYSEDALFERQGVQTLKQCCEESGVRCEELEKVL